MTKTTRYGEEMIDYAHVLEARSLDRFYLLLRIEAEDDVRECWLEAGARRDGVETEYVVLPDDYGAGNGDAVELLFPPDDSPFGGPDDWEGRRVNIVTFEAPGGIMIDSISWADGAAGDPARAPEPAPRYEGRTRLVDRPVGDCVDCPIEGTLPDGVVQCIFGTVAYDPEGVPWAVVNLGDGHGESDPNLWFRLEGGRWVYEEGRRPDLADEAFLRENYGIVERPDWSPFVLWNDDGRGRRLIDLTDASQWTQPDGTPSGNTAKIAAMLREGGPARAPGSDGDFIRGPETPRTWREVHGRLVALVEANFVGGYIDLRTRSLFMEYIEKARDDAFTTAGLDEAAIPYDGMGEFDYYVREVGEEGLEGRAGVTAEFDGWSDICGHDKRPIMWGTFVRDPVGWFKTTDLSHDNVGVWLRSESRYVPIGEYVKLATDNGELPDLSGPADRPTYDGRCYAHYRANGSLRSAVALGMHRARVEGMVRAIRFRFYAEEGGRHGRVDVALTTHRGEDLRFTMATDRGDGSMVRVAESDWRAGLDAGLTLGDGPARTPGSGSRIRLTARGGRSAEAWGYEPSRTELAGEHRDGSCIVLEPCSERDREFLSLLGLPGRRLADGTHLFVYAASESLMLHIEPA